ncbi:MAG: hypothetical protein HY738_12520 [Bacteroidia bacterium]|nr:hypothetical protein [Bacteroidia bacterium]
MLTCILLPDVLSQSNKTENGILTAVFVKEKTIISKTETVFNIVKVTNPGKKTQTFTTDFIHPENWNIFSSKNKIYQVNAGETIAIPFRISPSKICKGGVSYLIGVNLKLENGQPVISKFCSVNIKAESRVMAKALTRFEYFDPETRKSEMAFRLENRGNQDEEMVFDIQSYSTLYVEGAEDNRLLKTVYLPINADTIIRIPVRKNFNNAGLISRPIETLKIKISNQDTVFNFHIWFKELPSFYRNTSSYESPLNVEVRFANLVRGRDIGITLLTDGVILLKKNREIRYSALFAPFDRQTWPYARWLVNYKAKNLDLYFGDVTGIGYLAYGKGVNGYYTIGKHLINAAVNYNFHTKSRSMGIGYQSVLFNRYMVRTEAGYGHDEFMKSNSLVGLVGTGFHFLKTNNFGLSVAYSNTNYYAEQITRNGIYGQASLGGQYQKIDYRLAGTYSSKGFVGRPSANQDLSGDLSYTINNMSFASFAIAHSKYLNNTYNLLDTARIDEFMQSDHISVIYNLRVAPKIRFYTGNEMVKYASNQFYISDAGEYFATTSTYIIIGAKILDEKFNASFSPRLHFGYTSLDNYYVYTNRGELYIANNPPTFANARFSLNFTRRFWGISLSYFYGPYSFNQQYNYYYYNRFQKSIMISPFVNINFYDDKLQINARASYSKYSAPESERFNFNMNIFWYLNKGWSLKLFSNYYSSGRFNQSDNDFKTYRGFYIGAGIRKVFDIQQPRMKFYDITVVFYKDYDGNDIKDENEPGVRSVWTTISRDTADTASGENINFRPFELLSDRDGAIYCERLPEGTYTLKYMPIDKNLTGYKTESNSTKIIVDGNKTVYIPYRERNKVSGKVVIIRDKFSNLGYISPQNIKITAADSSKNTYSTFSLSDGSYILLVPNKAGIYTIHINNIFSKNFDLQQNDFEVDFDGFKEYQIDFIFNEKKRTINFNGTSENGAPGDAKSFAPEKTELDSAATLKYIDKIFENVKENLENNGSPVYLHPENEIKPDSVSKPTTDTSDTGKVNKTFDSGDNTAFAGDVASEKSSTGETTTAIETEDKSAIEGTKTELTEYKSTKPDSSTTLTTSSLTIQDTSNQQPHSERSRTVQDTPTETKTSEKIDMTKEKAEAPTETVTDTTSKKEEEIPVFYSPSEKEIEKEKEFTPATEQNIAPETLVLDDDPNLVAIYKITAPGITFRVKIFKYPMPRFSPYTFEGLDGVICVQDAGSENFNYYAKSFNDYREAKEHLKKAKNLEFNQAEVQAFKDGNPITFEEAGVTNP